jgi:hypothetical protein
LICGESCCQPVPFLLTLVQLITTEVAILVLGWDQPVLILLLVDVPQVLVLLLLPPRLPKVLGSRRCYGCCAWAFPTWRFPLGSERRPFSLLLLWVCAWPRMIGANAGNRGSRRARVEHVAVVKALLRGEGLLHESM